MKHFILIICMLFSAFSINSQDFVFSEFADLNGDGKTEKIKLDIVPGASNQFVLRIADKLYKDSLGDGDISGFQIVDIDNTDKFKEIAVYTSGASDDHEYLILSFNENRITKINC